MAEEDEHSVMASAVEENDTTRESSQKVPSGFGHDNTEGVTPNKEELENSIFANATSHEQNARILSIDATELPALPPPDDSSQFYNSTNGPESEAHMDTIDERAMQRHLNDVESSFMPVLSPISVEGKKGVDDTYLFDGAQHLPDRSFTSQNTLFATGTGSESRLPPSTHQAIEGSQAEALQTEDDTVGTGNTTSSLETMSSSPTAAATARAVSRAFSTASNPNLELAAASDNTQADTEVRVTEETPRKATEDPNDILSDGPSTLRHQDSSQNLREAAGNTPGAALLTGKQSDRRPKFLRSRHTSQQSSISSLDGSEITIGADYALQSGGAVPAGGFSRHSSMTLSRSISLGSMASGIEDYSGSADAVGSLATLTEEEQNRERKGPEQISPPETPRASHRTLAAPTDTIIARRVRNVQVPESVAQEFRTKNGAPSTGKRSGLVVSQLGRNGKNLTLKEQSSTIERLSKENFDLKLKVMFLSDRLDKLSEEGVKEMISENVELKTGLAVMQRDNKALRRKVKELEKQLKDDEERPSTSYSDTTAGNHSPRWSDQESTQEREEELLYLRERTEEYMTEIEKLRNDAVSRENEKRNLADVVRQMGERRGQNVETREEMDVWKDLLEQETARREQSDEDNKKLREGIFRLRTETSSVAGVPGLNHTTNIYNITKKRQMSPSRPRSDLSDAMSERNGAVSSGSTLVEELRKESEQLRHENAELRREVGAQTSMLTSRNREKERLYQEIEDLKLGHRKGGGSIAGDSILERSASRAHERSLSRTSAVTRQTNITDNEREGFENKHAELRDRINSLKIHNQDLQRELESCMEDFETAVAQKKEAEVLANELQEALEVAEGDLVTMQTDRDEALQGQEEAEIMFDSLRKEAQEELDGFAAEAEEASAEIERLQTELADTTENFNALQSEMREMSEGLIRLEDDHESKNRRIVELERELDELNHELEQMDKNLAEANGKINRFTVQQESSQSEIAFLREEQDGDKIKIGDLEAAIRIAEQSLQEGRGRVKEIESRLAKERQHREIVAGKEKQEVQQYINELNREASGAKDEARKLRKNLTSREVEAAEWKQRLMELEANLREALGDLNGTRSSLLNSIAKLQRELENTMRDLDDTREALAERDQSIKHRDQTLETNALEARKLADMLDKERQSHRNTKHQFETFQKTSQHTTRTLTQQETRVMELETSRQQDRRKIASLENSIKDQITERNQLLLTLWNRLSALCGSDWAHNNSLINGRALPSMESVANMLPGFSKNLLAAVKTLETLLGDFKSRIRSVEKDLWKEYQTLESNLDLRTKRLDRLETMARSALPGVSSDGKVEINRLIELNRTLKTEISVLQTAADARSRVYQEGSPSPSIPTGPRSKISSRTSTLTRHQSASAVETFERAASHSRAGSEAKSGPGSGEEYKPDLKWQVRLQELEQKLKAEREARLMDRTSARQRLEEKNRENAELSKEVEMNKVRSEMGRQ